MQKSLLKIFYAIVFAFSASYAIPAHAQATRTWVSGVGDDVNPCSRTAPCKTFAGAISKTAAGGEIDCLDPGGFGTVTITKSITIDCTGTMGSILASGTTGVIVNGANVNVILRGLSINGAGTTPGFNGVRFIQGNSLTIENCIIQNFTNSNAFGVSFQPSGAARLYVRNSTLVNNGTGATGGGILVQPTGVGSAAALVEDVGMLNNAGSGVSVNTTGNTGGGGFFVQVEETSISGSQTGVNVLGPAGTTVANVNVVNSTVMNNTVAGMSSNGIGARIRVSDSRIMGNTTGVVFSNTGSLLTYQDNILDANGTDGTFSGTAVKE